MVPDAPAPRSRLPRTVFVLAAVAFCVAAGFGIVAPAIPLFARSFGVSTAAAAAVVSAFAAVRLVSAPLAGRLVNRRGERPTMITGLLVVALSSALAGGATSYPELVVLRGIGGLGSAMFSTSAIALLLALVPSQDRGRASGLFSGGFLLGGISGPALGGAATAVSPRLPFYLYAATLLAATLVAAAALPRRLPAPPADAVSAPGESAGPPGRPGATTVRAALGLPTYRAVLAANFADSWAAVGVRSALVPLLVAEALHRSPTVTGLGFALFSAANAAVLPLAARWDRRGHRFAVLLAGTSTSAAGAGLLAVPLTHTAALAGFGAGLLVFGAGSGLLDVAPAALLGDLLPRGRSGSLVAAYQMSGDLGATSGPVLAGLAADAVGLRAGFALTAGVLLAATVPGLRATRAATGPRLRAARAGPAPR